MVTSVVYTSALKLLANNNIFFLLLSIIKRRVKQLMSEIENVKRKYLENVDKVCMECLKTRHPQSPCYTCQFFRELDLVDYHWVFKLPNPPNLADRNSLHAWCIIEVLDRYPQPLYQGKACSHWESRENPITLTYAHIKALHPFFCC